MEAVHGAEDIMRPPLMTTRWPAAVALLLVLGGVTPALAQEPAKLIDPHDKNAVRPGPGIELGFYDPATGLFTRGTPTASPAGLEPAQPGVIAGFIEIVFILLLGHEIFPEQTFYVEPFIKMGHPDFFSRSRSDVSQFTANYYAEANANFAVGKPNKSISIPFAYTPAGNSAQMSISVNAQVIDDNNITHSFTVFLPLEPVPNGNVTRKVRITM
jgi:hypothetical protein